MQKTIILGIGGTGLSAIKELRRLIAERYEKGLQTDEVAATKFIYIDTHTKDVNTLNWSVLGKDIRLTEGEQAIITGDSLGAMVSEPEDYDDIKDWLPSIRDYVGDPGDGAKGIRPYGRLIYEYNENKNKVRTKVTNAYNELNRTFPHINEWRIYLVCGLSGGTGSGMFIPLSFDLKDWDIYQEGTATKKFYSFLILPPLQKKAEWHNRYHPNAYAALRELNYYNFQKEQLPFDNCYLLESRNKENLEIGLENIPLLIAQRIFLNIQGGEAADHVNALMDNPQLGNATDDAETGRRHSLKFSTFGLSTVSYPRETVAQCLAYRTAQIVSRNWLAARTFPQDINQQVRNELRSIRLSQSHIFGDADSFGLRDYLDHTQEINSLVDQELEGVVKKTLGMNATKITQRIETGFREVGISDFYKQRQQDVQGAVQESLSQTRYKLTQILGDREKGVNYAKRFLEELKKILQEYQSKVSKMSSEGASKKIRTYQNNLADTISLVRTNEQKLLSVMYTNNAFQQDFVNISDEVKLYLRSVASYHAGKYGVAFLNFVIPAIAVLEAELDTWESRVSESLGKISGSLKDILKNVQKSAQENGEAIFSEESLEELIQQVNQDLLQNSVEESLKTKLEQDYGLDLIVLKDKENPEELIYQSAYEWVLSENSPIDIGRITLYDKFVKEYSKAQERQTILTSAKNLSAPFLKTDPKEVGKTKITSTNVTVTTIPRTKGGTDSKGNATHNIVRDDLSAIGITEDSIKDAQDLERIIFLQEKQVFPLRHIELVSRLKRDYDSFVDKSALHIDRQIEPNLYDLYLLSTEERNNILEAKKVWAIAKSYFWIKEKENKRTRKLEISYEFEESGVLGLKKTVLGSNWDDALSDFVLDAVLPVPENQNIRKARKLLSLNKQKLLRSAQTEAAFFDEVTAKLKKYLDEILNTCEAGIDDPAYEEWQIIVNAIIQDISH